MKKKMIAVLLAITFIFGLVPQAFAVTPRIYMDWRDGDWYDPVKEREKMPPLPPKDSEYYEYVKAIRDTVEDTLKKHPNLEFSPDAKIPAGWPTWLDQPENMMARKAVEDAIKFELYTGYYNSKTKDRWLKLTNTITRAEFASALARALDIGTDGGKQWYSNRVDALVKNGIIPNTGGNWNANITRAEMAQWMGRAAIKFNADVKLQDVSFPDTTDPDILAAAKTGVIKGYPDGTFGPQKNAQRVEAALMLINLAKGLNNNLPDVETFKQLAIDSDKVEQAAAKAWVTGKTKEPNIAELSKYNTPLAAELTVNLWKQGQYRKPDAGWAEFDNYRVERIELHNTVAVIKLTRLMQGYDKFGNKTGLNIDDECLVYLVKRNGRWLGSHAE